MAFLCFRSSKYNMWNCDFRFLIVKCGCRGRWIEVQVQVFILTSKQKCKSRTVQTSKPKSPYIFFNMQLIEGKLRRKTKIAMLTTSIVQLPSSEWKKPNTIPCSKNVCLIRSICISQLSLCFNLSLRCSSLPWTCLGP